MKKFNVVNTAGSSCSVTRLVKGTKKEHYEASVSRYPRLQPNLPFQVLLEDLTMKLLLQFDDFVVNLEYSPISGSSPVVYGTTIEFTKNAPSLLITTPDPQCRTAKAS
jgi:hypothetical protein